MHLKLIPFALALTALPMLCHSEDLLDAYQAALTNDPTLAQAEANKLSTAENVPQARASLLPQLSAGLSFSQNDKNSANNIGAGNNINTIGYTRSRGLSLSVTQTILDFSQYANLKTAYAQVHAADATYQEALQALYIRVATAYFNVLTTMDQLSYVKAQEETLRQQYERAKQRYKVGLAAVTDMYKAMASYESARATTISAQNELNDAREALTQITGTPSDDLKKLRPTLPLIPPKPTNVEAWVKQALQFNPTILAAQYTVSVAEHQVSSARAKHLPTVGLSASRSKDTSWGEHGGNYRTPYSNTVSLSLSVPLFQGGQVQSQVRAAIAQRDSSEDGLEKQRRAVIRNTLNYFRTALASITQLQADKASVESAKKALAASQAGFQAGTQNMLDVLDAIQMLASSQSNYSKDRHQFILNKLLLKQAAGTISLKDLQAVNALLQ